VDATLSGKNILLGVTGSIAAYKAADIVRKLKARGAEVKVMMTATARHFVAPWTFRSLTGHGVITDLFPESSTAVPHIDLAGWADLVLIAPATANSIGKAASGIADDMMSTVVLATRAPVCFAPAMNTHMLDHPAVTENIATLRKRGCHFIAPEKGTLACGWEGTGRLAAIEHIIDAVALLCSRSEELAGKCVLVTAGRTEEPLDPVRFLSNPATGKMGFALVEAARSRGAEVSLVSGPTHLCPPSGVDTVEVRTAEEMAQRVFERYEQCDILLMAAAVADFRPKVVSPTKMKKGDAALTLPLERTTDILAELGRRKKGRLHVGFALETEGSIERAKQKMASKNLDMIVLNDITEEGAGFGLDTNVVSLIDRSGNVERLAKMSKREVADNIVERLVGMLEIQAASVPKD
jgi:phosphopantothenoylcysteine decarboxylase/phosphopantothenate--cysteine ligase